jgi:cardiolipin synthase A/B
VSSSPRQLRRWLAPHAVFARGNDVKLLAGGAAYFPALLEAIDGARREIFLETYIFGEDATANAVRDALVRAAQRGVKVRLIIDGFGSGEYGRRLARELPPLGVAVHLPARALVADLLGSRARVAAALTQKAMRHR